MADHPIPQDASLGDVFDDAAFVAAAARRAFAKAAKAAVAENDRLGITTHGAINGRLVERHPSSPPASPSNKV